MTEKEKMLAGLIYDASDPELLEEIEHARDMIFRLNNLHPSDSDGKNAILGKLLGKMGKNCRINLPFYCDYGSNIEIGDNFFSNFNLTILDEAMVIFGNNVFVAPNVSIYTAGHPVDPDERNTLAEYALPVTIGSNVWIGGSVTIIPGVTIGDNVTIGAGSVVVKDIPSDCIAVGNPCRPIRKIR